MLSFIRPIIVSLGAIIALLALLVTQYEDSGPALGSAPAGLPASLASTSQITVVAATVISPVATSTSCSARIVATASTTAMVHVGEIVPTASRGYFIAASTTQIFDGGIYGCGTVKVYPFATGVITVTETQ